MLLNGTNLQPLQTAFSPTSLSPRQAVQTCIFLGERYFSPVQSAHRHVSFICFSILHPSELQDSALPGAISLDPPETGLYLLSRRDFIFPESSYTVSAKVGSGVHLTPRIWLSLPSGSCAVHNFKASLLMSTFNKRGVRGSLQC